MGSKISDQTAALRLITPDEFDAALRSLVDGMTTNELIAVDGVREALAAGLMGDVINLVREQRDAANAATRDATVRRADDFADTGPISVPSGTLPIPVVQGSGESTEATVDGEHVDGQDSRETRTDDADGHPFYRWPTDPDRSGD